MELFQSMDEVLLEIRNRTKNKRKIVFVSGNFNIVHPGHLRLLRFAAECGDFLVVGVNGDNGSGVKMSEAFRLEMVCSVDWVDLAFVLKTDASKFIEQLQPSVVVKGKEHENRYNLELTALESYGGKLLFGSGDISFSSVDLLREEFQQLNHSTIIKPVSFLERHDSKIERLINTVRRMQSLNVCVVGDIIVDEYITCEPLGMSQEDPTIVVSPVMREKFIGGAGIVAAHAKGLGADVHYFSVLGNDESALFSRKRMEELKLDVHFYEDDSRPTTLKQRFRAENKTLLRVNHLRQHGIRKELQEKIFSDLIPVLENCDLLIFSDFNYGCLPQSLVDRIISSCKERNVTMVADSQSSSQVGDVSRFKGMELLTPTEREARLAIRDFDSGIVVLSESLRQKAICKNVLLTLGAEGVLIHAFVNETNSWLTDELPPFNNSPKDPAGAGDSMLTCASMALVSGANIWESAYLGSLAAACQVGRLGNVPLSPQELLAELSV
jgi:rfaE bifunctional protein kinase chain/domain